MRVRKRIITLGLILGLTVNQIILYESKVIAEDNINSNGIPKYILTDIKNETKNRQNNNYQVPIQNNNSLIQYGEDTTVKYTQNVPQTYNGYVNNSYNPNRPEWRDFCPHGWENVTLDPKEGTYLIAAKANLASARRYWYERRTNFEKDVSNCDMVQPEYKNICYQKIAARQLKLNQERETYVQQLREEQLIRQQQAAMFAQQNAALMAAQAEADKNRQLIQQELLFRSMQPTNSYTPTTYRFYNQYGQPQGYVRQSAW